MGRGRAKAKQTKVARQLKYNSPEMDLDSLQRELAAQVPGGWAEDDDEVDDQFGDYADYADYGNWDDEDEDEDNRGQRRVAR